MTTRPAFVAERGVLAAILAAATTVSALYRAVEAEIGAVASTTRALDVSEQRAAIVAFAATLRSKAESLSADVTRAARPPPTTTCSRRPRASSSDAIELFDQAPAAPVGEDFVVLPEFAARRRARRRVAGRATTTGPAC